MAQTKQLAQTSSTKQQLKLQFKKLVVFFVINVKSTMYLNSASLGKWLSVRLRSKWFWVRIQLQSLKSIIRKNIKTTDHKFRIHVLKIIVFVADIGYLVKGTIK